MEPIVLLINPSVKILRSDPAKENCSAKKGIANAKVIKEMKNIINLELK